jgi:hypothetical protein
MQIFPHFKERPPESKLSLPPLCLPNHLGEKNGDIIKIDSSE